MKLWLIIPAAGIGSRMNSDIPKQYLKLNGKTVLEHTLQLFNTEVFEDVAQITLCIHPQDCYWQAIAPTVKSERNIVAIEGGETRAHSVLNGLNAISELADPQDWVLVHDAARPCLSAQSVLNLIDTLENDDVGGILAVKVKDTLKQSNPDGRVNQTLDRSTVWQAQTPQMFRFGLLKTAIQTYLANASEITDEASAIEAMGFKPKLVEGEQTNIKITSPDDLALAEFLLKAHT